MDVIWRADHNCIDFTLHLLKHRPEVDVLLDARVLLERQPPPPIVHVAQRDNVLVSYLGQVGRPSPTSANHSDVKLLVRRVGCPR